jgi:hypothetical protein
MNNPTNDIYSESFESKCDPYFTAAYQEDQWGRYRRWDKDAARSALATTRPRRAAVWAQGTLGMRMINAPRSKKS